MRVSFERKKSKEFYGYSLSQFHARDLTTN